MSTQFLDTNVLLYAYDSSAGEKHRRASDLVLRLARSHQAGLSVQVMQEFYVNAVSKIAKPLERADAVVRLEAFSHWNVHSPLASDVIEATRIGQRYQLSFWDSMIVWSAMSLHCDTLWSEDLNHGQIIESVTIRNPFV